MQISTIQIIMIIIIIIIGFLFFNEVNRLKDSNTKDRRFNDDFNEEKDDEVIDVSSSNNIFHNLKNENIGSIFSKKENKKSINIDKEYSKELELGDQQYKIHNFNKAKDHLSRAIELKEEPFSLNKLAHILVGLGEFDEALKLYEKSLEIDDKNSFTLSSYASLLSSMDRLNEAEDIYSKVINLEPRNKIILYNFANLMQKIEKYDIALTYYKKALDIDKDFKEAKTEIENIKNR